MKATLIIAVMICCFSVAYGQSNVTAHNTALIDSLENIYLKPCLSYVIQTKKIKQKLSKDIKLIELLNQISKSNLSDMFKDELIKFGFEEATPENKYDSQGRKIYKFYKYYGGNLRGFVQVAQKENKIAYQRILIATNTHFFCNMANNSFNQFYVDFPYLKQFLNYIKFPLSVAKSNTELQFEKIL